MAFVGMVLHWVLNALQWSRNGCKRSSVKLSKRVSTDIKERLGAPYSNRCSMQTAIIMPRVSEKSLTLVKEEILLVNYMVPSHHMGTSMIRAEMRPVHKWPPPSSSLKVTKNLYQASGKEIHAWLILLPFI